MRSALCLLVALFSHVFAQPPAQILLRTLMVRLNDSTGTIFSIDVDGREYWITAAHVLTGSKGKPYGRVATETIDLKLLNPGGDGKEWIPVTFKVFQPEADVDIAVLVPPASILPSKILASPPTTAAGLTVGGNCEFLGFALGGWRATMPDGKFWFPFVKKCSISGQDYENGIFILDGINNPGFSGGPVIFGTGVDVKIAAVVSGYVREPAAIVRAEAGGVMATNDSALVNSGFIIAYNIKFAIDVIKANPVGPLREARK